MCNVTSISLQKQLFDKSDKAAYDESIIQMAVAEIKVIKDVLKFQLPFDMDESVAWNQMQQCNKVDAAKENVAVQEANTETPQESTTTANTTTPAATIVEGDAIPNPLMS